MSSSSELYLQLLNRPPVLKVPKNAKEVVVHVVSCMCDNKYIFNFKKNKDGEFKLFIPSYAYSNFQIKHYEYELEWSADRKRWQSVFAMINGGVQKVEKVVCR